MTSPTIYKVTDPNLLDNMSVSTELRANKGGKGQSFYINHKSSPGQAFYLQLGYLRTPTGISVYEAKDTNGNPTGVKSYSIMMSLDGYDDEETHEHTVYTFLTGLQEKCIEAALAAKKQWFTTKTHDGLEALFDPLAKFDEDGKYPPSTKVKFYINDDGDYNFLAFNTKGQKISCHAIERSSYVNPIVSIRGYKVSKFGVTMYLQQVMVNPPVRLQKTCAFELDTPVPENIIEENEGEADTASVHSAYSMEHAQQPEHSETESE